MRGSGSDISLPVIETPQITLFNSATLDYGNNIFINQIHMHIKQTSNHSSENRVYRCYQCGYFDFLFVVSRSLIV